ncbi:hypothetical protein H6F96_15265 [Microcoleus sp. FACHB-53]|nr:hypothetical protein [Microcoleus sp. FACHB-53]
MGRTPQRAIAPHVVKMRSQLDFSLKLNKQAQESPNRSKHLNSKKSRLTEPNPS